MARPVAQMGSDLRRRTQAVIEAPHKARRQTLNAAGMAAKNAHMKVIRRDTGGDARLSRVGASKGRTPNPKVGTRYKVEDDSVIVKATGPLHFVANDMSRHPIASAYAPGSRAFRGRNAESGIGRGVTRRMVINIPGVGFRRWASHPGTKGKDTWNRGRTKAGPAVSQAIGQHTDRVVRQAFRRGT